VGLSTEAEIPENEPNVGEKKSQTLGMTTGTELQ